MKTFLKSVELIVWIPMFVIGFICEIMRIGFYAGKGTCNDLHGWMDKTDNG